jgi:hypothetical protein
MLYALPISSSLTLPFYLYLTKSRSHEATHYAVSSNLQPSYPRSVQIFSSPSCSNVGLHFEITVNPMPKYT